MRVMSEVARPPVHLIVLAGGLSTRARRADSTAPKQFRTFGGAMLFMWSVRELLQADGVVSLTVTVPASWEPVATNELTGADLDCPWQMAIAGGSRTASTWQAASVLAATQAPAATDLVAVHDAARPFASHHLLNRLTDAAAKHEAAVPGVNVPDTIVHIQEPDSETLQGTGQATSPQFSGTSSSGGRGRVIANYLNRAQLQAVQTPQVFRWQPFYEAHCWAHENECTFTDDGGLLSDRGTSPVVVMGEADNWKITTESDWQRAQGLLPGR
jgi:2-C-methyl-D-erythritol 4-phosphate cytidylyltransferase/2-C-methyl-D-erythritol 2,4-cyclodiphosphate synthase